MQYAFEEESVEHKLRRLLNDHPKGVTINELHELTPTYGIPHKRASKTLVGHGVWGESIYLGGYTFSFEASIALSGMLRDREVTTNRYGKLILATR